MARYDRIAALEPPPRAQAFSGWTALRDLEGRERDTDLARRARLRFLALRPVRRLLQHGIDGVAAESYERQIEGVREQVGALPAHDDERARLAEFLRAVRERTPRALAAATLAAGEALDADGHRHAAEEYYRTGLELADSHHLASERIAALRLLDGNTDGTGD